MSEIDPILISVRGAAKALDLNINTVYKLCDEGQIASVYYGTRNRKVVVESLREFAANLPSTAADKVA